MNQGTYVVKVVAPLKEVFIAFDFMENEAFVQTAPESPDIERLIIVRTPLDNYEVTDTHVTGTFFMEVPFPGLVRVDGSFRGDDFTGKVTLVENGLFFPLVGKKFQ